MSTIDDVQEQNRELARKLADEARSDPHSAYAGKMVGLANGQVVVVADNWDDVARRLQQVEPDSRKTFCLEVGRDYNEVQEIWESRRCPK
jgi:hypothetical protein